MKTGTTPKTLRIPNDTIAEIERVAKEKKTSFSKEAIRRLQNKDSEQNTSQDGEKKNNDDFTRIFYPHKNTEG